MSHGKKVSHSKHPVQALDPGEIQELSQFLSSPTVSKNCMTLEEADGFFCALSVVATATDPEGWLPVVWGGQSPLFDSEEQWKHILDMLLRHWIAVTHLIGKPPREGRDFYAPILFLPAGNVSDSALDTDFGKPWARGFHKGVAFHMKLWERCLNEDVLVRLFAPVIVLEQGKNPDKPEIVVDFGMRKNLAGLLPSVAYEFHLFWESQRPGHPDVNGDEAISRKLAGRNDPCPCGSGKKYKKCCGAG